jgi:hypothetical protein
MYNSKYNFSEAHLNGKNDLPVIVISLSHKEPRAYTAVGPNGNAINEEIRKLHDLNGFDNKPPFR